MRLHPAVSEDEAYAWLKAQIELIRNQVPAEIQTVSPSGQREGIEEGLRQLAADLAAISQVVLPDDVEPLFP